MPTLKRVDSGRNHWYKLDGKKCDGVTTIISDGVPKPALPNWAAREVATFAVDHLDTIGNLEREAAIDLMKGAPWRDRDAAARRGTEVHKKAEELIAGGEVEVPVELTGHVDAYLQFLEDWQPTDELVELTVWHEKHKYAGTLDMIATLRDGKRWLLDIKTTRSGIFGEVALQLAAYRNATHCLIDGEDAPMPQVDCAGAIWVRSDGYDLYPVETGQDVFRSFLYAQQVAKFQKFTSKEVVGDSLTPERAA